MGLSEQLRAVQVSVARAVDVINRADVVTFPSPPPRARFARVLQNKELAKLSKQVAQSSDVRYAPGDTVIVTDGDLKNLLGVVDRLDADGQVVIQPKLKDFKELIRFPVTQLNKFFKRGDHVKARAAPRTRALVLVSIQF